MFIMNEMLRLFEISLKKYQENFSFVQNAAVKLPLSTVLRLYIVKSQTLVDDISSKNSQIKN